MGLESAETLDARLGRMLRGGDAGTPDCAPDSLLARASYHGIAPLLFAANGAAACSGELREALRRIAQREAAVELGRKVEVARLLEALAAAGIEPLLLKGFALAYTIYPQPWARPRGDVDLLVAEPDRDRAFEVLREQGYQRAADSGGNLIWTQASFRRGQPGLANLPVDLHWRISNSPLLACALEYDALRSRAQPIPALGPAALAPALPDSLLHACLHRAGHTTTPYYVDGKAYPGGNRLIWLYDIHLLAQRLDPAGWETFTTAALRHRLCRICLDAFAVTRQVYVTPFPDSVTVALEAGANETEPSAALLTGRRWRILAAETGVLPNWTARLGYLREHAFPTPDYMLRKYDTRRRWLLPALYVRRALGWLARA